MKAKRKKKNNFKYLKSSLLYCLLLFFCASCGKGGTVADEIHVINTSDSTYPVVEVNTPADNQVFTSGSAINVTGKVSDNSLYQGSITIRNDANGAIVKEQYYEIHYIPIYNFSISYTPSVTASTDYTVIVKFEDHGHNQTIKAVQTKVNP
jgi:hypothetical protein